MIACHGGHGLPRELLSDWWDPGNHGYAALCTSIVPYLRRTRLHVQEVPIGMSSSGVTFHPSVVPFVSADIADVHFVCVVPSQNSSRQS